VRQPEPRREGSFAKRLHTDGAIAATLQKTQRGKGAAETLQSLAPGAAFLELNERTGIGDGLLEDAMASAEYGPDSINEMDRFVVLMAKARKASDIVDAVRAYLSRWPSARVARVQLIDAGWAPFDDHQQPVPLVGSLDVRQIYDAVRGQVVSLRESGMAPTPEFLELELIFFFADLMLEKLEPDFPAAHAASHASRREMPNAGSKNRTLAAGR